MNHAFAIVVVLDALTLLAILCLAFPELYRAPIRAYRQLRTALLFMQPLGFGRDVSRHPIDPDSEAARGLRKLGELGLSMRVPSSVESPPCVQHASARRVPDAPILGSLKTSDRICIAGDEPWDDVTPTSPKGAA